MIALIELSNGLIVLQARSLLTANLCVSIKQRFRNPLINLKITGEGREMCACLKLSHFRYSVCNLMEDDDDDDVGNPDVAVTTRLVRATSVSCMQMLAVLLQFFGKEVCICAA
jgi:hypothetical protein